jgi:Uncharacterized protein conserved in bacteria
MEPSNGERLLLDLILSAKDRTSLKLLLSEICTPKERATLIQRVGTAKAILDRFTYRQIHEAIGSSSYIISRAKQEILGSENQYVVSYLTNQDRHK